MSISRNRLRCILLIGAIAALLVVAACVTTGGGSGSSPAAASEGNGAAQSAPTAKEQHRLAAASGQGDHATINGRKEVALATFEGDLNCSQLVAPYTLQDNAGELLSLATNSGSRAVWTWFDEWLNGSKGKAAANASLAEARHNIPLEVRTTAVRMNWLPMKAEVLYGQMALEKWGTSLVSRDARAGRELYPQADALLAQIVAGIAEPHEYNFVMHISSESKSNALALPGGLIVVDAELIKNPALRGKAQFAIAHEVAHVLQRHETRAVQARIIDTISLRSGVTDLIRSIRLVAENPRPLFQLVLAGKRQFERHSEVQELHSDSCGTRVLDRVLKSKPKLVAVLQAFVADMPKEAGSTKASGGVPSANGPKAPVQDSRSNVENLVELVTRPIDRHPTGKERIDNFNRILRELRDSAKPEAHKPLTSAKRAEPAKASEPKGAKPASAP